MTIKELYELAKLRHCEDLPISIEYTCSDDWYSYCEFLKETDIHFLQEDGEVVIDICKL